MVLARALPAQAEALAAAEDPAAAAGQLALTFSRVSRAIRQTLALEARLRQELPRDAAARPTPPPILTAAERAEQSQDLARRRAERKAQLRRAGRQAITDRGPAGDQLVADWDEQVEELAEDDAVLLAWPFSAVVAEICEALEITPDWSVWRQADWAVAELRDRPTDSEYADIHDRMIAEGVWAALAPGVLDPGGEVDALPDAHPPP